MPWSVVSSGLVKPPQNLAPQPRTSVPEFHGLSCELGNFLRHEYDSIDLRRVWLMIEDDLPPLKAAVRAALNRLR